MSKEKSGKTGDAGLVWKIGNKEKILEKMVVLGFNSECLCHFTLFCANSITNCSYPHRSSCRFPDFFFNSLLPFRKIFFDKEKHKALY